MDKKYQIFISSTFTDLRDERRRVTEAILNLGHIPVGMELFQAGDDSQWTYIQQSIEEADYYVVIVGERYGSEVDGKSYTQLEYEYATEKEVPVAAFLLAEDVRTNRPANKVQFEKKAEIDAFRALCEKKLCQYWEDDKDLALKVNTALSHLFRSKPRIGWVRADKAISPQVTQELSRLSEEKRALQATVEKLSGNTVIIPAEATIRIEELEGTRVKDVYYWDENYDREFSLLDVFQRSTRLLAKGCYVQDMLGFLQENFEIENGTDEMAEEILSEFVIRKLADQARRSGRDLFTLTAYGKDFILYAQVWQQQHLVEPSFLQRDAF